MQRSLIALVLVLAVQYAHGQAATQCTWSGRVTNVTSNSATSACTVSPASALVESSAMAPTDASGRLAVKVRCSVLVKFGQTHAGSRHHRLHRQVGDPVMLGGLTIIWARRPGAHSQCWFTLVSMFCAAATKPLPASFPPPLPPTPTPTQTHTTLCALSPRWQRTTLPASSTRMRQAARPTQPTFVSTPLLRPPRVALPQRRQGPALSGHGEHSQFDCCLNQVVAQ